MTGWQHLSPARQANALRAWWRQCTGQRLPDALVQRLLVQWPAHAANASRRWPVGQGWGLLLYRGRLSALPGKPDGAAARPPPPPVLAIDLTAPTTTLVPAWAGRFECRPGTGLALADLRAAELRPRQGGERFQLAPRSLPRCLKKQYQALALPAHARTGPLVWAGQRLLYVPGLGMDARALAGPGQPQLALRWLPDADVAWAV